MITNKDLAYFRRVRRHLSWMSLAAYFPMVLFLMLGAMQFYAASRYGHSVGVDLQRVVVMWLEPGQIDMALSFDLMKAVIRVERGLMFFLMTLLVAPFGMIGRLKRDSRVAGYLDAKAGDAVRIE